METIVYAEVEATDCLAVLYLNGIPLFAAGRRGVIFNSLPVRQFLVEKTNQLELVVEPVERPSEARGHFRKLTLTGKKATARLVRYPEGEVARVENGQVLVELSWASDGLEATYPLSFIGQALVPEATAHWSWQDAPLLELDDSLRNEAVRCIETLADTIRRRDLDGFMAATEVKLADAFVAYPRQTQAGARNELGAFIEFWTRDGADPIVSLDPDAHDFRLVAGGRMLEAVDRDGYSSLRLRDPKDGEAIPYPLYLARIGGVLRVVR